MLNLLAQTYDYTYTTTEVGGGEAAGAFLFSGFFLVIWLALVVVMLASMWKIFEKAGVEGWKAIVPVYNTWVLAEIVGKPGWWGLAPLLMSIPIVNFIAWIPVLVVQVILSIELAKSFGKEPIYAALFILLPYVGYPYLAFAKENKYVGPGGKKSGGKKAAA
jgi:hypothetical protein